ncbi:hypothetical protein Leryth_008309 [Lithospermum erythrorhizon]|uniref:Oxidoreductase n=1 Tax=Lithospermum erythrorhizon TaxID=34254 RepID=A0AAV3QNH3_LITER|nr:hypothetical protein Leryth_008309 [Lithospermum erythrorhizon]
MDDQQVSSVRALSSELCCPWEIAAGQRRRLRKTESVPTGELSNENVHLVTTTEMWEEKTSEATENGKMVVVNFSTPWCKNSRVIASTYCQLANKNPSIVFLTINVEELREFCASWEIKATPTFFFLKDGREVDKLVGANKAELQKKIMAIAASPVKSSH